MTKSISYKLNLFILCILLSSASVFAWPWSGSKKEVSVDSVQILDSLKREQLKELQREIDALARIRLQKADSLEKLEAEHWRKRYNETQLTEEHQIASRELDGRYSKLSTDLGRINEEVQASKEITSEIEEKANSEESSLKNFNTQIKLAIDKTISEVTGDYPIGMNNRLLRLREGQNQSSAAKANCLRSMKIYMDDALARHELTYTQNFGQEISQMGNRPDIKVNRLRLGTIFLGEVALDESPDSFSQVQTLTRSGNLQGKIFDWNATLPKEISDQIQTTINDVKEIRRNASEKNETSTIMVPLDILQNKAIKKAIGDTKELTWQEKLKDFFKKGGIVMYPLLLVAIFAMLLCLERFIVLSIRGRINNRFVKKLNVMILEKNYDDAVNHCLKQESALAMVLSAVLSKASETRESAERALQEALLREQPKLERRMGLLAAMGTIAPLLGLLGTVTGIITLFNVITEVGTNDARVLAGGISEALITTETGLVIAIPVMILHGLLSEKIEKVVSELYVQSTSLLNKLFPKD